MVQFKQRENRWMSDVNRQISKTLVRKYGENTLFGTMWVSSDNHPRYERITASE